MKKMEQMSDESRELLRVFGPDDESRARLADFITYLEATSPDEWCEDVVRSKDGSQNCALGHVFEWGRARGDGSDRAGSRAWDWFEGAWSTSYAVYPVNDGTNPDYPQPTPKERIIAYCRALLDGTELSTMESMEFEGCSGDEAEIRRSVAEFLATCPR